MKINKSYSKVFMLFIAASVLAILQFWSSEARAESAFFSSAGCSGCHSAPATSTCNGCHSHGTHPSSAKSSINVTGTTNKTSYAPGETVSVTIAGGYRTGWVRAVLYNQNSVELARSTGNSSGMGSSTTLPAVLTAPAPATSGAYTWKVAWYGNKYDISGASFGTTWTPDVSNPNHGYQIVNANSFTVVSAAPPPDAIAPVVSSFAIPATSTSLTVPISAFSATDNVAVTGYILTESATVPTAAAAGWSATAPASYTFATAGAKTLYAWVKDAAGNVSAAKSATVTITLPDSTVPVVSSFAIPATSTSLTVPISAFSATDNVAVTGYMLTESATVPTAAATGWSATAPASYTFATAGAKTLYARAKDAAGNISAAKSATVTITLPDTTAPVVGAFTLPMSATGLTVPVLVFTASDNMAVTGYMLTESATAPATNAAGWSAAAPSSYTFASAGAKTLYAWAKDAAGNIASPATASVTISLPDTSAPVVSSFVIPSSATSLTVPVSALTATDNVAVTGFMLTEIAGAPTAAATGWSATAPSSYTFAAPGSKVLYAWAKDAAGNVSATKSATVIITLPDTTAPVVGAFTLPMNATGLTVPVLVFTASDNMAVTGYMLTESATAPAANAAGWSAAAPSSYTFANAGAKTLYAWAKDAAGNIASPATASVTISLPDTSAPVVSSFAIPPAATSLTVPVSSLTATDNVAVTGLMLTEISSAPTAAAAGWSATTPASHTFATPGSKTLYAWAKDSAGNVSSPASAMVTVTLPSTVVTLNVSTLPDGSYTNNATLNVSGNAGNSSGIKSVTVNGQDVALVADGSFSTVITLLAGANTITVLATDNANNQSTDTRTVNYDPIAPMLTIIAPADNSTTVQSYLTVNGTVSESSRVTIAANNGSPQSASISGNSFTGTVNLMSGVNTIVINAIDLAGNTSSVKRTVNYTTKFTLAVTNPSQDITTRQSSLLLTGTVTNASKRIKVIIAMDGRTYTPAVYNGIFKQQLNFTSAKKYVINVTATDDIGNRSTVVRNVIYSRERERDDD